MTKAFRAITRSLNDSLRAAQAPVIDLINPGLSPVEIRAAVGEIIPTLLPIVDGVVESWWSWHNGVDFKKARASGKISAAQISPGSLTIQSLEIVLQSYLDGMGGYEEYRQDVFPICDTGNGGHLCIATGDHGGEWTMHYLPKEKEGWIPIFTEWGAPQPTFSQYLDRLTVAIRNRHAVVGPHGAMVANGSEPVVGYPFFRD